MQKTSNKTLIAIDKTTNIVYNTDMLRDNNTKDNRMNKVYQIMTSVKLDPNSKAYKKAIAKSKGMLTGSPDIYQTTGKFVDKKAD